MEHQVRPDGTAHEASTAYHRLVTELFVCGTQAAEALVPGFAPGSYRERLDLMLAFARDYTRPDGLAAADRRRRRRAVPPTRGLRRRPTRPPAPLLAGWARPGAGGRECGVSRRRLLRPSEREPVRDRALRRRRTPWTRWARPQRPAVLRARRCPRPARRRPRAPSSTRPIRSSATASARRRSTRRCASADTSRTSSAPTTSSR